jgi:hypothetical protein
LLVLPIEARLHYLVLPSEARLRYQVLPGEARLHYLVLPIEARLRYQGRIAKMIARRRRWFVQVRHGPFYQDLSNGFSAAALMSSRLAQNGHDA